MKKNNFVVSLITAVALSFGFSVVTFANSSWAWITQSRPYDVLPFVIVFTLVAETYVIKAVSGIRTAGEVFVPVLLGNLLSYAVPYITYSQTTPYAGAFSLGYILERGPFYTVGVAFLITTLVVEIPVVYMFLKKKTEEKRNLILADIGVNAFTTVVVAIIERVICRGRW